MWIRVLKTWCGIEGMFVGDSICEVDDAVVEKISDEKLGDKRLLYEQVPAPWDAQKDVTAVRVGELQGAIAKATVELERLEEELLRMQHRAGPDTDSAVGAVEQAEDDQVKAEQLFRQIEFKAAKAAENAGKHPSEGNAEEAANLAAEAAAAARAVDGKYCLAEKAKALLLLLKADIGLTELEVIDARAELAVMQDELYELRPDLKPKEDEDGATQKTESPDGPGSAEAKDAADAEGQTDAAGQVGAVQDKVAAKK